MSENNKKVIEFVDDRLEFDRVSAGTTMVYEELIRTYFPKNSVSEVTKRFDLSYTVYYCRLAKCALVTYELLEQDESFEGITVHMSRAEALKVLSASDVHDEVDNFLNRACMAAVNMTRDVLRKARFGPHVSAPHLNKPLLDDDVAPEEIPF